jgi:hypothetical protein
MDGDTLLSGSKTIIRLDNSFNVGKAKPIEGWENNASKTISMGPNSEMEVSGFESWDETGKDKKRYHGESIKNIELKKGFFSVSYGNTSDVLSTPMADLKFLGRGGSSGNLDVYDNILYSNVGGERGVEYTNKKTKATYLAKSNLPQEIIVNERGIYKRGMLSMDDVFSSINSIGILSYFSGVVRNAAPEIDPKKLAESYKNIPQSMGQTLGSLEMFGQMSPEDMARLMRISEEHGQKFTPEMKEQMKELPEVMKSLQQKDFAGQMKEAMAKSQGMMAGLGDEGIDRLVKNQSKGMKASKEMNEQLAKIYTAEGKYIDVAVVLESKRVYKPLVDAKKVA